MATKKIRVYELARELGVENAVVLDLANELKIGVKSHSSSIDDASADPVRRLADSKGLREAPVVEDRAPKPPPPPATRPLRRRRPRRRAAPLVARSRPRPVASDPAAARRPPPHALGSAPQWRAPLRRGTVRRAPRWSRRRTRRRLPAQRPR